MDTEEQNESLPMLPLRGALVYPNMVVYFDVGREQSLSALETAMQGDKRLFVVAQKNVGCEEAALSNVYGVGSTVLVKHVIRLPDQTVRVMCEGERRAFLLNIVKDGECTVAECAEFDSVQPVESLEALGYAQEVKTLCTELGAERGRVSGELLQGVEGEHDLGALADLVAANTLRRLEDKQAILECRDVLLRLKQLAGMLQRELELAKLEKQIDAKVRTKLERQQQEYFLREQIKAIQEELGEDEAKETDELRARAKKLPLPSAVREKLEHEIDRCGQMPPGAPDSQMTRDYIDWILAMPWEKYSGAKVNLARARKILEADHYGLTKVKERIIEYLAVRGMTGATKGPILCLVGPPGVGKTSIAQSLARAAGRKFVRISLGGVRDEAEIRGHRRTYLGALPGRIIAALKQCGSMDPVFLLDEVDKMSADFRGDPAAALLEALDPEQNNTFTDHYLDLPFDLSRVLFVTTANTVEGIPQPLLDRMEMIEAPSYTQEEKLIIAKRYLWPKQLSEHGMEKKMVRIADAAIARVIAGYTREAGVRELSRLLGALCRKAAVHWLDAPEEERKAIAIKTDDLERELGPARYLPGKAETKPLTGVVNGLAWTQVGGCTLPVEVAVMPGSGTLDLTGRLGDVMKESARAAYSYIRAHADDFHIDPQFSAQHDVHIHVPEGAVPKDGPSAGVALTCAMLSAITGRPARQDVAMTGEVTLRGRVLPIGGVKEKLLAAHRLGIDSVLLPRENERDLAELPTDVRERMDVRLIEDVEQAISVVLN